VFAPIRIDVNNPGPLTGDGNHTYLIAGVAEAVLIDAGTGDPVYLVELSRHLADRRLRLSDVLVTHAHVDHAGGVDALRAAHPSARFRKYPWPQEDARYPVPWQPLADGEEVPAGAERLTVLHTPGHSPDHVAFWHAGSRTLFSGDLVVQGGSVMLDWSHGGDLGQYLQSLERLQRLEPRRLLPAHGPEPAEPLALLADHLAHRRLRERQVLAALAEGRETVSAIAESIYHGLDARLMPAALENVRAHLDKLRNEGRASAVGGRWVLYGQGH
jgi:glyoxylase-like metal-dependent hydrolase (beta-lactamase superfamily II)